MLYYYRNSSFFPPMSLKFFSRLLKIAAVVSAATQSVMLIQSGMENFSLKLQVRAIQTEINTRNKGVEKVCKEWELQTTDFWFDRREFIPRSTACIVDRKERKDSLVLIRDREKSRNKRTTLEFGRFRNRVEEIERRFKAKPGSRTRINKELGLSNIRMRNRLWICVSGEEETNKPIGIFN